MIVPVRNEAAQQIRAAQKGGIPDRRAAEHDVIAATRSDMPAVEHEFLGTQPAFARGIIKMRGARHELIPARARFHIDLDDAGIRRDLEIDEPRIRGRLVAFDDHRLINLLRGRFHCRENLEVVIEDARRGHEDVEDIAARLGADGGSNDGPRIVRRWNGGRSSLVGTCRQASRPPLKMRVRCKRRKLLRRVGRMHVRIIGGLDPGL